MLKLVIKYLQKSNYSSKIVEFEEFYQSHPNYPSLLAITDGLNYLNIENIAASIPFEHFDELTNSFIAELKIDNPSLYLLTKGENEFTIEDEEGKVKILNRADLEKYWSGIVLLVEENEKEEISSKWKSSSYMLPIALVLLCLLSISTKLNNHLHTTFLLIAAIGVFISKEILETFFNNKNNTDSKFCSISEEFSCDSIIKSKSYSFSKYIEFVDLPVIFFSFSFISLLFGLEMEYLIGLASVLSLPVLFYSIYLQKFSLKKWCLLCLLISVLMLSNAVLFLVNYRMFSLDYHQVINAVGLLLLIVPLWFLLKKWIEKFNKNEVELNKLLRFKRSEGVFQKTVETINNVESFNALDKMIIGDENAPNVISLFLSPSCPHCHTAYKDAKELLMKYPNKLKLAICYNLNTNNVDNPYLDIARSVLNLYNNGKNVIQALDDWHIERLNIDDWKAKWKKTDAFTKENNQLEMYFQWCLENEFNYAPVKIFNNHLIEQQYNINELFYFFKE